MYPGSITHFLKYSLFSGHSRGHGIHSPLIFDIVTRVLRNKIDPVVVFKAEELRKKMLGDQRTIDTHDYGAGHAGKKGGSRKVSEIARYSAIPAKYGELLARLAGEYGENGVLELGTSLGISTLYMALGNPDTAVKTIEGCPESAAIAKQNFAVAGAENVNLINSKFRPALEELKMTGFRPGLVFIDGDHQKESLLGNFREICSMTDDSALIAIDDIYLSSGMHEAWISIKDDRRVSATLDIFRLGLVLLRGNVARQHYMIRY